ncbi:MAG TPA: DNA ligase D [Candidatus Eisenbacteria bacterium]|nr:DNA ligase D [Candidatus Eisenbacteria bacterium]
MIEEGAPQLEAYRKKRDPERTPEPFGDRRLTAGQGFVVQKHAARRLHYDLRLEMDGVLKSWAVPKGPSVHAEEKRLAVHVEDHPVEYADFEGVIAHGNYGAGSVIVWDRGWYRSVKPEDPLEQLRRGKLEFELFGYKLRGRWTLARMSGKDKEWLLLKKADGAAASEELTERYPQSVLSGLTVEEMADVPGHLAAIRRRLAALDAPRREVTASAQAFMLATLGERAPSGKGWLFEIKFDGVRVLAARRGERVELYGRSGQLITGRYPDLVRTLHALPVEHFVADGEIVALDARGRPSFQRLQPRMALTDPREIESAAVRIPVEGVFFDCVELDGHDVRRLPLIQRKECLQLFMPPLGPVHYVDHVVEHGDAFLEAAAEAHLEGIVAKKASSVYMAGRSRDWIKIKCQRRQEFVIGGYTDPQGARGYFGALHIGLYDGARLVYVSKVGTGFDQAGLKSLWEKLQPLTRPTPPFDSGATPTGRGHHWVEPRLVCEVRFTDWTNDGGIRHPTFLGLRSDTRPEDCRREELPPAPPDAREEMAVPLVAASPARGESMAKEVRLTNLKKVFWPADGYTKGDLVAYYEKVAPLLLPYLRNRPLVLTRYPDGIAGKSFYQKDAPEFAPAWVRTERVYSKDAEREIDYFVVDDVESLRYVANSGAIPLHLWASRLGSLERPDWLVLDLDPKGAPFTDVVKVAQALHRILDDLALPSYPKTSGATGLHILIPLGARYVDDEVRTFARLLAVLGVEAEPDISTIARPLRSRGGKVYIDFGQNGHGQTIVAPFSLRPLPGAPASCPLRWSEVTARLDPARFTIVTVPKRFDKMADPLVPVLTGEIDMAAALARMEQRFGGERDEEAGEVRNPRKPGADARKRGRSRPPRA